ncbi:MAG: nucleotidyltransferase family protein [Gemmatimonadaceae bacterium]
MRGSAARARQAGAVYDFLAGAIRGADPAFVERVRAFVAPLEVWRTVLVVERCGAPAHAALAEREWYGEIPADARTLLREAGELALRQSISLPPQLDEIAELAAQHGIEVMALKGAARLIRGELAGVRTVTDIDLLARDPDCDRLHHLLRDRLGYHPVDEWAVREHHHLRPLTRAGSLAVEIHTRPTRRPSVLSDTIWRDAGAVRVGNASVLVPSAESLVLHTLEHALSARALRYRLRDIADVAAVWGGGADVDADVVLARVAGSPDRDAMEILLSAAHDLERSVPAVRERSWATVRRVARARLAAWAVADERSRDVLLLAAAVMAEGSAPEIARLCAKAVLAPALVGRVLVSALRGGGGRAD